MKALVLAAGFGTRLQPLTLAVPKPMIPIVNKPIMEYNIELLKQYRIKEVYANIHYFPEQIENYFADGSHFGVKLRYSYEEELLGTAGGVRRMASDLAKVKDTFIVVSSDALTDINITRLVSYHKQKKAIATIALATVDDPSNFGVVAVDNEDRITAFQEKPSKEQAISKLVNTGIYVFEPQILDMIPEGHYDFGKQLFPILVKQKAPFFGYKMVEYWSDIGSIDQLKIANADVLKGYVRANVPGRKVTNTTWINKDAQVDPSAKFEGTVYIGFGSVIGKNVELCGDVVIGDRTVIKDNSLIVNSVIWSNSVIGSGSKIKSSLIANWCTVGDGAQIDEGCVISNRCKIAAGKRIDPHTMMEPDKVV